MVTPRESPLISNKRLAVYALIYSLFVILCVLGLIDLTHAGAPGGFDVSSQAILTSTTTLGVGASASDSSAGSILQPSVIFATTAASQVQQGIIPSPVTFATAVGIASSGQSILYSSVTFSAIGASSASSGLISPNSTALTTVGSLSDANQAILANPFTMSVVGTEVSTSTSPSGGFGVSSQINFYPPVSLLDSGGLASAGSGGVNVIPFSAIFGVAGSLSPNSTGIFRHSVTYLAGDYYQNPVGNPITYLQSASLASLEDVTVNNPPLAYPWSTASGVSISSQVIYSNNVTLSQLASIAVGAIGHVVPGSVSLSVASSGGADGYTSIALSVPYSVATVQGPTNTEYTYPSYTYPVVGIIGADGILGGGNASTSYPVNVAYANTSQYIVPVLRYGETVNVGMGADVLRRFIKDGSTISGVAGFSSSFVGVAYVTVTFPVVDLIAPSSGIIGNNSALLSTKAYQGQLFRRFTNIFFKWKLRR